MAPPSFDCAALLCAEDNTSVMGFDDEVDEAMDDTQQHHHHDGSNQNHGFLGDFLMGFPLQSDECLRMLIERESYHVPKEGYLMRLQSGVLDLSVRRDAVDWIGKVHAHYSFGPLSAYLSVNYLDRFLSAYELPQGKLWMMQLLSVACLSLAAKMEETEVPLTLDLQVGESKFVFESRTIQRMELLVLSTLNWRMQAVTPFSFIDYFLQRINDGKPPPRSSICRSIGLILNTIKGVEFLEFRPSEVAAAVAISVLGETQVLDINKAVSCCLFVEKERVLRCYEQIQEMVLMSKPVKGVSASVSSVPQSPIGVLDAACLSYKSDDITVGSCANSHTTPSPKRRKLNR
ncbi:cyclin-D3-1-like isoform X2 [Tasmannia lanceolata]|uniref:cyclin-D3-1-like isoform X2 n=1 Tax=Tasmannia lanceolata TaxID=3420 RepID=UPI00406466D1